ncbi:hypothetical protein TBLA_0B02350 [Henningerozyma blattae CBS 6284]|uniref:Vacuolar protein sorting-associated protein 52 n=1 Tax=Henningerozyma blattae (strain ATCC 34711 / CBS 6284 / DSM 70876 / NBRC 10599 / NRRL Y-10934 / UCD 77-7) TaxID=1071380 RepID=I2GY75_HENB6|nr:hypothetical protein TBLA_0B02350 [Tetrapisispora blattae CBS 6284]CCH59077.1 hypothetical protein TBLA_0B02350 [Tetrapisispora blattae CBS 6284]
MDALSLILNVPKEQLQPEGELDLDKTLKSFLQQCQESESNTSDSLLDDLETLEKKHNKIEYTINDLVPKLRQDIIGFNNQLQSFTNDLGYIREKSNELKSLLESNSTMLKDISPLVDDLILSPNSINDIINGKICNKWQSNIEYIRNKREIYSKYNDTTNEKDEVPIDFKQLNKVLDDLEKVLLERSKKFIVHKIKALRNHDTIPSQKIQEKLLEVKEIFPFIVDNNYSLALELRQAYAYTMRWYYKSYFARYIRSLTILPLKNIDNQYALGNGLSNTSVNSAASYLFPTYLSSTYSKSINLISDENIADYFQINKRLNILTQADNTVMVSQIAENNPKENYLEIGFKNLNLAILDNCKAEFKFLNEFFHTSNDKEELSGILEQIFQPTLDEATKYTEALLEYSFDIFGVLISIRIGQQLQYEANRSELPVISDYINSQLIILWPKFQQLVDFQCDSIRKIAVTTNIAKGFGTSKNSDSLTTPHELTVQFSQFLTSFLTLAIAHKNDIDERSEPVYNSITRLRNDFETIMTKCSKKSSSPERFLATNYLYLYNALQQKILRMDEDETGDSMPLIIKETEEHYSTLVRAFSEK